jgi:hypothetical protein
MLRWTQNSYFGGNAVDQFIGIKNSFQDGKNIDVRSEPRFVKLAEKPVRNASGVIADWIMDWVTIQATGDVIAFGDTGKIYRQTAGTGDFALAYTDSSNRKITDAYEYNGKLVWATQSNLHYILVANIDATWSTDVVENWKTFTNGNTTYHPMLEVYNNLLIGDGKHVAQLDALGVFTGNKLPIFGDEQVVKLTFNGSVIKVYSQRTANVDYGRSYLWNGTSGSYQEFLPWPGAIHSAGSLHNLDYVLAGRIPTLYASNGYNIQPLTQLPGFARGSSGTFNHNAMTAVDSTILFGSVNGGTNTLNRGIWSFGRKNKDYPQVLNNEYSTSNGSASDLIGAVHVSNGKVYMGWKNGTTYGIDVTDNSTYAATGELVSRAWDGGYAYVKKEMKAGHISFKTLNAGEKIDLYVKRNLGSSWGSPILTVDYADTADRDINYKEIGTAVVDPFNFLETKVVLTAGTNSLTTPAVGEIVIDAEPVSVL